MPMDNYICPISKWKYLWFRCLGIDVNILTMFFYFNIFLWLATAWMIFYHRKSQEAFGYFIDDKMVAGLNIDMNIAQIKYLYVLKKQRCLGIGQQLITFSSCFSVVTTATSAPYWNKKGFTQPCGYGIYCRKI